MLSYCHSFHAGNQADVFKHALLFAFLSMYTEKAKPFTAFDVHAGHGVYNLTDADSIKTGEAYNGIIHLLTSYQSKTLPEPIPEYFEKYLVFCKTNYEQQGVYYGSPALSYSFLDDSSHLIACELHPAAAAALKSRYKGIKNVHVHKRDGYETVLALSPPHPVRGFAFFDPSYELDSDYINVIETIKKLHKRWFAGSFIIWYPIVERKAAQTAALKHGLACVNGTDILMLEIPHKVIGQNTVGSGYGLKGSGMCIINPPWGFDQKAIAIAEYLKCLQETAAV